MNAGSQLHAAPSLEAADWLVDESGEMGYWVSSLVPEGFDAYVRILHPADVDVLESGEFRWATWRETAAKHGKDLHPEVHWEDLVGHLDGDGEPGEPWPWLGSLPEREHRRVVEIAARNTASNRYWLAWWNGYGIGPREARLLRRRRWFAGRLKDALLTPLLLLPGRREWRHGIHGIAGYESPSEPAYLPEGTLLFERPGRHYGLTYSSDPLAEATFEGRPIGITPQLWWPDDRSWIAATEIDLVSTYIAGSDGLVDELMADDQLEAIRVEPGHSICLDRSRWG